MPLQIKKAVRQRVWLKIAITGPSGAGKTWGAIAVAKGLAPTGKVLVIDTENESASLYAERWDFDTITIHSPFTTQKYAEALEAAIENGYEVVVIDSLTHEWAASGGILDQKTAKDARGGNSFSNWGEVKQLHNRFVERLLHAPIHVVGTLRSKMAYAQEQDERGKTTIRKVGLAPITSDELEYEFSAVLDIDRNTHLAVASKDRTSLFEGRSFNLSETIGKELATWLNGGKSLAPNPVADMPEPPAAPRVEWTEGDLAAFHTSCDVLKEFSEKAGESEERFQERFSLYDGQRREGEDPDKVLNRMATAIAGLQAEVAAKTTPDQNAAALAQMVQEKREEPAQPVSQEAEDFVDGLSPAPAPLVQTDPKGPIAVAQFETLCDVCKEHQVPLDKLEAYSVAKGYLTGTTLSTMRREKYDALMKMLLDDGKRRTLMAALVNNPSTSAA